MAELKTHHEAHFISESQFVALSDTYSRTKTYKIIRREAKYGAGMIGMACSGKEAL